MKYLLRFPIRRPLPVTPLVGVWIEMRTTKKQSWTRNVTPLVGVWIEISISSAFLKRRLVTPLVGVWIEITVVCSVINAAFVTPLVGVWIEILEEVGEWQNIESLPLWECGLKCAGNRAENSKERHSLCGSVD